MVSISASICGELYELSGESSPTCECNNDLDEVIIDRNHPGYRTVFSGSWLLGSDIPSIIANLVPRFPGISPGYNSMLLKKHGDYRELGWDIIALVSAWPRAKVEYRLADATAIKEVTANRARFPKPVHRYGMVSFFGGNIVVSEGDEWKMYRKIAAPSFSERNIKLAWDEACRVMLDLFENVWGNQEEMALDNCVDMTMPVNKRFLFICMAGFGQQYGWKDEGSVSQGHTMSFKEALDIVSTDVFLKIIVPKWASSLTRRIRRAITAYDELELYMLDMIHERKSSGKQTDRHDLFNSLLDANEEVLEGEAKLSDRELLGNIFMFLLAGHETTAHTLCFALGLLACYPEEQDLLYQEVKNSATPDELPVSKEESSLCLCRALYETLRLFPPVPGIPKYSAEDTTLTTTKESGESKTISIPAGVDITIDCIGLHHNPRYWSDPDTFRPARFLEKDWPRDAFMSFSGGPRACIGRRFFESESVAMLVMLVSRYRIEVIEEPRHGSETLEQRNERVLSCKLGLTLTPVRVPLVFRRRDGQ
ncbi:cytochrome P450 [Heliocybe sulcata]|uniref:Cytochrome P450 n=1 Tax=Heliocybe sulcata TaxID=5364 RepID=A0A5C3MZ99_9AGAM|nr:cytochrome P450 [Heliocybe sulcata]